MASTKADAGPGSTAATIPTEGLDPQEAADRQAVAEAWIRFWDVIEVVQNRPAAERESLLRSVTGEPLYSKLSASVAEKEAAGEASYGTVAHRIYWGPPIEGRDVANIGDCTDTSKYGARSIEDDKILTRGLERDDARGVLRRQASGQWIVTEIRFMPENTC
ncbi:hypothetical protein GIS00_14570 [Nakamurella sp. YIM 132087]|uniref:Nuclear transport factor 2 family protein n=1 Tax=Nakamurella alba TaxID=2665158 RepID=A0A7K1FQU9_9ACTN|nr:hypothetical protein [Nakamurella alba]MTD15164.1 hypothetical protein [Nakamurella alba]